MPSRTPAQRRVRRPKNVSFNTADAINAQKELSRRSLSYFVGLAWPQIDTEKYSHNWHIDAIAEHLEAVAAGDIKRLLINIPPGTSKSMISCVMFPAWLWGPGGKPSWRVLTGSFSKDNAKRDNRRTRELVESAWYQRRWATRLKKREESYIENTKRGFRQAAAVSKFTGKRGHVVIWDDPLDPEQANSEADRERANRVFSETLQNRLIDPATSSIIIIMQRLHQRDVSGLIIEDGLNYEKLILPMEFDPKRRCETSIGFKDPRTEPGELLDPKRHTPESIAELKKDMSEYAWAGQYDQAPTPRGGGLIKRDKFRWIEPDDIPAGTRWVRGWDLASSEEIKSAFTAACLLGETPDGKYIIRHVKRIQKLPDGVEEFLKEIAAMDGKSIRGSIPQDPGSAGKTVAINIVTKVLKGYPYFYSVESGDKVTRAEPLAAQINAGNVYLVKGEWNTDFLDEAEVFPAGRYKDQIDAASRAFMELNNMPAGSSGLKGKYGVKSNGRR